MKIQLISIGIVNRDNDTLDHYVSKLIEIILETSINGITIFLLPEYCWGNISEESFNSVVKAIEKILTDNSYIVYGTFPIISNNQKYNMAFFGGPNGIIQRIPKTRVLAEEIERNGVIPGINPGVIEIGSLRIAIIICADIWDNKLLNRIIKKQLADVLLIPAFTVVPVGHSDYARIQWYSLAIVRSREYLVPIAIADHMIEGENQTYTTGKSTLIVDPSLKSEEMRTYQDFLNLSDQHVSSLTIDLDKIKEYRTYRIDKGLYQKKSSRDN